MSKYKYLIIILMIMKSLSYSKAADFSNIFILDESCEDFNKRMEEQGLPLIGQTFETYEESFKLNAEYQRKNIHQLNKEEYTVLMNSIPRINDTLEDVNKRNSYDVEQGTTRYNNKIQQEFEDSKGKGEYKLQQYSEIIFKQLKIRYPQIYETYYKYSRRLKKNKLEPLGKEFVNWLKMLFPIFGETYDEYTKRMEEKLLIPMQRESFILYQIYYPIPWVEYKQFNKTMDFLGKSNIFPALGLEKFPQEIFDYLKSQFPEPFESQESFDKRIFVNKVYDRIFSKRIYPKMSETFLEYMERIENIFFPKQSEIKDYIYNEYKIKFLTQISKTSFKNYKKYYPEFNLDYSEIRRSTKNDDILVTISLSTRMPIVFETFPHYKQRMFMLALNGLDEEEFNDLKRTYIEQCETYMNYVIRMQELEIKPMDFKYALQLKIIVPREDELDPTSNEDNFNDRYKTIKDEKDPIIMLEDSSFFIEHPETAELATDFYNREKVRGNYQEGFTGKRRVVKFHKINRQIFILIHPRPYENYTKYKDRIGKVRENYVFEDSLEIEPFGHEIFKTFIQPLTENEFKDLKSRFPKLSETMHSYTTRLEEYRLPIVINPNLFKTFKRSQIQPFDKFEIYQLRYQKLESNKKKLLAKMNISFCEEYKEYNSFPSFLKTLDPYDYKDMKDVCPKYYHTLTEYNTIMENLYLQQFEMGMFIMIKEGFPHLLDNDYGKYKSRVDNSSLSFLNEEEFMRLKSFIPKRFESLNAFEIRISINIYTADDIENFKSIYPKVCSTLDEFTITMQNMGIVSLIKETYEFYNNQFPERDETKYDDYHKRVTGLQVSVMSQEEFNLLRSRFPKPHERYSNYIKNLDSSLFPLDKSEFNDLKKLFSIPYETYAEHYNRLKSYFKEPLSPENFRIEKSLRVLVGESFIDHVVRIIDIFNGENGNTNCTQDVIIQLVNHQGMETLEVNNFIDHMLTYPFNYDSFEKFCSRQENKFKAETDPLVKTLSWYNRMKTLLPKLSDNTIEDYQKRVKEDKLEFPDITLKQFYRHKYGLPHPGELFSTFELRTKPKDSNNSNIEFSIPPSVIPLLIDISPSTPPIPPTYPPSLIPSISSSSHLTSSKPKPVLNRSTQINKITTIKPIQDICWEISKRCTKINKFNLCPEIHEFFDLKKFKKEVYETFISISPNFYIDHDNYSSMDQERRGDLLQEADFLAFKKGLPKLDETFYSFNKRIEPMGVIPNYKNNFEKLKIFYPRIHQITYDNYILDIEIKYDNTTTDYRDIINKLKLSRDEFTEYKLSFPRQFDFSYSAYKKRMEKEKINKILSEEDYNVTRQMNYPLVNETYKQHSQKLSLYGVDPIPQDIFKFLKRIYPTLLEKTYEHRVKYYVCEFLKLPNYAKDKYNIANEMIAEIIDKSNPDQEIQDKVNTLLPQRMSNEEMSLFIDRFPIVFQSHTDYLENYSNDLVNLPLDERLFHSLKTAYFISIDEIYEEYKARMESLELRALALNIFRYCKKFYPDLIKNYDDYKSSIKEYENFEIKNPYNYKFNKLLHLEIITISEEDYQTFQKNFPRAFDTSVDRQHVESNASIFNHDNSDSIKTCYFPRLNEYYDTYITRIVNLGLNVLDYKSFVFFKAIYPNPVTALDYKKYKDNIEFIDQNMSGPNVDRRHIMTETEFEHLTRNFPKLFQSWEKFSYNRRKTKTNSMINDTSDFFKNLFNDLKMVYYPKFGQTVDAYTIYILTMDIWCDSINWRDYFVNAILLYPTFFDEYNNYELNTYELPSGIHNYKLDYLKLNEEQFNIFYRLFPLPYESYTQYKIRKADLDLKQFCLTEEEFSYWQQVFPQISETYTNYKTRLESELYVQSIVSNVLFKLFKELFPQIDECYNSYQTRFDNALKNSNEDTKKQLSFLVTHMDFKAMHIISDTKSGGMAYKDFKVFKNSLPMPEELRDDYINRINYLAEVYNEDLPEILPLGLFNNLVEIYPKHNVSDYTTYCENMKEIDVIPVSKYTFDQLVTVAKKMIEQRYDVTPTAFYNVVSKDHENFPNH